MWYNEEIEFELEFELNVGTHGNPLMVDTGHPWLVS
jgi:hypothetical protein